MKSKKRAVLGVLLSTGLYLLDNLRERIPENIHVQARSFVWRNPLRHRSYQLVGDFDRPERSSIKPLCILLNSPIFRFRKQGRRLRNCSSLSIRSFQLLAFYQLGPGGLLFAQCHSSPGRAVVSSASFVFSSSAHYATSPFPQPLVPAAAPQTESGSESSPFSDLRGFPRLSQVVAQSHAQNGSSPPLGDGQQKCRLHVDQNRIRDSRELSSQRTQGHRFL